MRSIQEPENDLTALSLIGSLQSFNAKVENWRNLATIQVPSLTSYNVMKIDV